MPKIWLKGSAAAALFAATALATPQVAEAQWWTNDRYGTQGYGYGSPYRGGERLERFDREPDWSGYNRRYGTGYGSRYYGSPYAGGERMERFDREPDWSGYNQRRGRTYGYGGYGYGGDYPGSERYYDRMEERYDRLESESDWDWF